jgi:hypothetical protein
MKTLELIDCMKKRIHFSTDGKTPLCKGRKKREDELTDEWSSVTCNGCLICKIVRSIHSNIDDDELFTAAGNQ